MSKRFGRVKLLNLESVSRAVVMGKKVGVRSFKGS